MLSIDPRHWNTSKNEPTSPQLSNSQLKSVRTPPCYSWTWGITWQKSYKFSVYRKLTNEDGFAHYQSTQDERTKQKWPLQSGSLYVLGKYPVWNVPMFPDCLLASVASQQMAPTTQVAIQAGIRQPKYPKFENQNSVVYKLPVSICGLVCPFTEKQRLEGQIGGVQEGYSHRPLHHRSRRDSLRHGLPNRMVCSFGCGQNVA